jgi:hypothetical protein
VREAGYRGRETTAVGIDRAAGRTEPRPGEIRDERRAWNAPSLRYTDSARVTSASPRAEWTPSEDRSGISPGWTATSRAGDSDALGSSVERSGSTAPRYPLDRETRDRDSRVDRVYRPVPGVDLSGWAPARARVPALSGSRSSVPLRVSPSDAAGQWTEGRASHADALGDRWRGTSREGLAHDDIARMTSEPITRASILQRYRRAGVQAVADEAGRRRTASEAKPDSRRASALASQKSTGQRGLGPRATSGSAESALEHAREAQRVSIARLAKLNETHPESAKKALRHGEAVATATTIGVKIAVSTGFGVACGGHPSCGWWWASDWNHCAPAWNGCWPGAWWWWGNCSCWWPWWGSCWNCGFNPCGFWWYGSPYYAYPYAFYCSPPPIYYSYVIYDNSAPPAQEVVEYPDPAPAADPAPAVGEASMPVPAAAGASDAQSPSVTRAVSEYLSLGDRAFREGRYSDAVYAYAKATEYAPGDGVLHLILSDALFATGDYHYAAFALRKAIELDPKLIEASVDKHAFYGDPTELDRQLALLARYVEDHFVDDDARLLLAANYLFADRPSQAADLLDSAFSLAVRESSAGKVIYARARALAQSKPH